ncbi:MAG: hypothetical protein JW860_08095 [Sedimentisphaerales bacterium]|nr:hypothetical protein [Sedimentisphaerales bacterium]
MKRATITLLIVILTCIVVPVLARPAQEDTVTSGVENKKGIETVFAPLEIYIDSGDQELAAYQFELRAVSGKIKIVGVEGGAHPAYQEPPYYDPAALARDRIIIAAFNTSANLPQGKIRIATVHLQILGTETPDYEINLTVAASPDGSQIPATITLVQGEQK